jgi:hypothetical protein
VAVGIDDLLLDLQACFAELKSLTGVAPERDVEERRIHLERRVEICRTIDGLLKQLHQDVEQRSVEFIAEESETLETSSRGGEFRDAVGTAPRSVSEITIFRRGDAWRYWCRLGAERFYSGTLGVDKDADELAAMNAARTMLKRVGQISVKRGVDVP